jgi:hypothetical protein
MASLHLIAPVITRRESLTETVHPEYEEASTFQTARFGPQLGRDVPSYYGQLWSTRWTPSAGQHSSVLGRHGHPALCLEEDDGRACGGDPDLTGIHQA